MSEELKSEQIKELELSCKLLTYNLGLLAYKMFGCLTLFANPPFGERRIGQIPKVKHKINYIILIKFPFLLYNKHISLLFMHFIF